MSKLGTVELQLHEVTKIEIEHCQHSGRRWIDFKMFDIQNRCFMTVTAWHPEADKNPELVSDV